MLDQPRADTVMFRESTAGEQLPLSPSPERSGSLLQAVESREGNHKQSAAREEDRLSARVDLCCPDVTTLTSSVSSGCLCLLVPKKRRMELDSLDVHPVI
ncbi:hypothetical protein NQZ68_019277 [Dissostichus eleginoides]|nr:hypothetical protein NQZ68_019277 [Dissostichus eleginoides]